MFFASTMTNRTRTLRCCSVALAAASSTCVVAYTFQGPSGLPSPPASFSPLFRDRPTSSKKGAPISTTPFVAAHHLTGTAFDARISLLVHSSSNSGNNENLESNEDGSNSVPAVPVPAPATAPAAPSMTLLQRVDAVGQNLKPLALTAKDQSTAAAAEDKSKQIFYTLKSCVPFALFIAYRAYRGLFVLLPAVFRETYRKLEASAILAPFVSEADLDADRRDVNPETGRVRFRTRATVSVLSMMVTLTYVVSGAWRVLVKMMSTLADKGSLKNSFEAAADELLENEDMIKRSTNMDLKSGKGVNGNGDNAEDGLENYGPDE